MTHCISSFLPVHAFVHLVSNGKRPSLFALLVLMACGETNSVATHSVDVGPKESSTPNQNVGSNHTMTEEQAVDANAGTSPMLDPMNEDSLLLQPKTLDDWERQILANQLRNLRDGVRLFSKSEGFGLCTSTPKGPVKSTCGTYVGGSPGVLAHGEYFLRAHLKAPSIGEDWLVRMEEECTLQSPGNPKSQILTKVHNYNVLYKGPVQGKERFYPVRMRPVQSPNPSGRKDCSVKLYSHRPDVGRKPDLPSLSAKQRILIGEVRYTVPGVGDKAPTESEFLARFPNNDNERTLPPQTEPKSESKP